MTELEQQRLSILMVNYHSEVVGGSELSMLQLMNGLAVALLATGEGGLHLGRIAEAFPKMGDKACGMARFRYSLEGSAELTKLYYKHLLELPC